MAEICYDLVSDGEASAPSSETASSRAARRRRMELRRFRFGPSDHHQDSNSNNNSCSNQKRQKLLVRASSSPFVSRDCDNAVEYCGSDEEEEEEEEKRKLAVKVENGETESKGILISSESAYISTLSPSILTPPLVDLEIYPKFGVTSVCGRRRDMEDAVAIHPSLCRCDDETTAADHYLHYFGVYDGHGCSHVATRCRERLHELVREEVEIEGASAAWKSAMERSFWRMDKEVIAWNEEMVGAKCKCEMQTPECDAVGSTAVVAVVTAQQIIVANCGDSRAVLCRNGKPIALSSDHKPDRPDELNRIQDAGGRVIYWDGPRVLGVLAMSRAIGDNYLKPYVSCEPEVTVLERTEEDECVILASDGLWDVVSNETACGVARMCLRGKGYAPMCSAVGGEVDGGGNGGDEDKSDKACLDASMLLTKLALARHSTDNVSVVVVDLRKDT